jgi:hypothetical protein
MILRLTLKLAKKIGIAPLPAIPCDENRNPMLDWCANLFTVQRTQFIIMTNSASLYSLILHGRGITNDKQFVREVLHCMEEFMIIDGNEIMYENFIEPESKIMYFSKIIDRRILGSMNDLISQAKYFLIEKNKPSFDVSILINETPMSYLKHNSPRKEFQKLYLPEKEPTKHMQKKDIVIHINDCLFIRGAL